MFTYTGTHVLPPALGHQLGQYLLAQNEPFISTWGAGHLPRVRQCCAAMFLQYPVMANQNTGT